ncbi:glutathione S-transferase N-terminal domain-containing protein [Enterovirga aerilata]|uniref:Glutathione S-transferase n=1 Tax=Enterovirga aerilata TaxID=2730920 RepID=A0A849HZ39_9HYPH|nr:glutathione S-transferase N-terminal domain-containing protein [Enterovirga sp. DB1703]NNM72806.1 glutathione S-transferase [Enterovirga sp. DB1703]
MNWREPQGPADLDVYTWPTPNGRKVTILLAEAELPYNLVPVDTAAGVQFEPDYAEINPNRKIPALVDHRFPRGGGAWPIFESGAILLHLAERTGRFLPADARRRSETLQWLMWQASGFGPMLGQAHHFRFYAPEQISYCVERYTREAERLYRVLDRRLEEREYVVDEFSIADIAIWPWIVPRKLQGIDLEAFPNVARWNTTMKARPGVRAGFDVLRDRASAAKPTGRAWSNLFDRRDEAGSDR